MKILENLVYGNKYFLYEEYFKLTDLINYYLKCNFVNKFFDLYQFDVMISIENVKLYGSVKIDSIECYIPGKELFNVTKTGEYVSDDLIKYVNSLFYINSAMNIIPSVHFSVRFEEYSLCKLVDYQNIINLFSNENPVLANNEYILQYQIFILNLYYNSKIIPILKKFPNRIWNKLSSLNPMTRQLIYPSIEEFFNSLNTTS